MHAIFIVFFSKVENKKNGQGPTGIVDNRKLFFLQMNDSFKSKQTILTKKHQQLKAATPKQSNQQTFFFEP